MRPQRVLFYSDMSVESDQAFPMALEMAQSLGASELHVVHVLHSMYRFHAEIIGPGLAMNLNPGLLEVALKSLRDRYEPALHGRGGVFFHVRNGVVGVELLRFIRKNRIEGAVVPLAVAQRDLPSMPATLQALLLERCPCPLAFISPGRAGRAADFASRPLMGVLSERSSNVLSMDRYRRRLEKRRCHECMG